jgi:hypothetical protein
LVLGSVAFLTPADPLYPTHRLNAARRLLEVTTIYKIPEADGSALSAVSEAAYLLLSDGCDLFNAVAFGKPGREG